MYYNSILVVCIVVSVLTVTFCVFFYYSSVRVVFDWPTLETIEVKKVLFYINFFCTLDS